MITFILGLIVGEVFMALVIALCAANGRTEDEDRDD